MATVSTPYAVGTISSVSGTTLNISGGAVAGWVGRCIRFTNGTAKGQIRKILSVVSATQITIDYALTISPIAGFTESNPTSGDSFVISHFISDFADGTSVIIDPTTLSYRFVGASTFSGGVFIYAANARIDLVSSSIACNSTTEANRVCWRLGDIDSSGNVFNGCHLLDTATGPSGFGTGSNGTFDPDFHIYSGIIRCTGSGPFWRVHVNGDSSCVVRFIGCSVNGNIGGRFVGSRSILKDWIVYGNTNASGPFNPKSPFGLISNIKVSNGLQALYHYWPDSTTLEAEGIKPDSSVTKLVRFANIATSGQMLTIKDVDISVISAMPLLYSNSSGTYSNTFRLSQYLNASYVNTLGSLISDSSRFVIKDLTNAVVYDSTTSTGTIPKQTLRYREMTVLNTGDYSWSTAGGTTYAPYVLSSISYNYTPAKINLSMITSQTVSMIGFADNNISQTNKSIVDTYLTIDNLDALYDRCKSWSCDNLALSIPSFGSTLVTGNGSELNFGAFNIVIDSSASSTISVTASTITIKSSLLDVGTKFKTIKTTGTITFNGSSFTGNYSDSTGSYVGIIVSGLLNGTRVQVYNITDSTEIENFIYNTSYKKIIQYTSDKTIRVRATYCSGLVAMKEVESTGILTSNGVSFLLSQSPDVIYVSNNINGSLISEFNASYPEIQVNVNGTTSLQNLYAWYRYYLITPDGIRNYYGGLEASDEVNYIIYTSMSNIKLNNMLTTPVILIGGNIIRDDGSSVIATNSGSIQLDPSKAYISNSSAIYELLTRIKNQTVLIPGLVT